MSPYNAAFLFASLCWSLGSPAEVFAAEGGSDRAGGIGIIDRGKLYLADFAENGIESSVSLRTKIPAGFEKRAADFRVRIANRVRFLSREQVEALTVKLMEIAEHDWVLANLLLRQLEDHTWTEVNFELTNPEDYTLAVKSLRPNQKVLALRGDLIVRMNAKLWRTLPFAHQIGLLLHELVYSLMDSETSDSVRSLVFMFFDHSFRDLPPSALPRLVKQLLPVSESPYTPDTNLGLAPARVSVDSVSFNEVRFHPSVEAWSSYGINVRIARADRGGLEAKAALRNFCQRIYDGPWGHAGDFEIELGRGFYEFTENPYTPKIPIPRLEKGVTRVISFPAGISAPEHIEICAEQLEARIGVLFTDPFFKNFR